MLRHSESPAERPAERETPIPPSASADAPQRRHWIGGMFRRARPSFRQAPPLRNAHYLGLHIAAASPRSGLRRRAGRRRRR